MGTQQEVKKYSLDGPCDIMCFLMTKCGILCGKSFFSCEFSDFWDFMNTGEEPHPQHCVFMKILQGGMNPNRTLYGRFCRSVNEILCPVGAILMYFFSEVIHIYISVMNLFCII